MEAIRARHPDKFPVERYPDIFAGPKAREIFDFYIDMYCNDGFWPPIGDCGGIGKGKGKPSRHATPAYSPVRHEYLYAVERFGDPRHARACTDHKGRLVDGELWQPYPERKIRRALLEPGSSIERKSRLLDGYGLAILESGHWPERRTVALNYTSLRGGHRQRDNLSLYLFARGVKLLPDLGYPETWSYRGQWDSNSLAHNTVTVDETQPSNGTGGMGRLFASANGVHVITASHNPYPKGTRLGSESARAVDLYERTVILIDVDERRSYVVDLFAVNGGEQHDQSWHALPTEPEAPALDWKEQTAGTLAGPEVPQFAGYTDRWGRPKEEGDFPSYLAHVRHAKLSGPAVWAWKTGLPEGDTLRLHVVPLGGPAEVIMGAGRSPVRSELDFLLVRRQVKQGEASHFLTVLDAHQGAPVVASVRVRSQNPLLLEVTRADGVDEIGVDLPKGPSRTTAHRPVGIRVRTRHGGKLLRDVRIGRCPPAKGLGYVIARIGAVEYGARELLVSYHVGHENAFAPGRVVRIHNADRSALFMIEKARRQGDRLRLTLDHTALVARGRVKAVGPDKLVLDAHLTFCSDFAGAWLGEGTSARRVKAATQSGVVVLEEEVPSATLGAQHAGAVVSIWQYGVGDSVEGADID